MRPLARRRSCKRSKLLCCGGSRACRAGAERRRVGCSTLDDNYKRFTRAIITITFCPLLAAFAQELTPTPTPQTAGEPVATTFEVIVTGSNIPTAEEVGPQPVDTYRKVDIERLGVRSATDFVQKLPAVNGASLNENLNVFGDGRTEIDLRGLFAKETLVLQDGRRLATDGFAGYNVGRNFSFTPTVDRVPSRISRAPFGRTLPSSFTEDQRFARHNFKDRRDNAIRDKRSEGAESL